MIPTKFCKTDVGLQEMAKTSNGHDYKERQNQKTVAYAPRTPLEPENKIF